MTDIIPLDHRDDDELATLATRSRGDVAKQSLAILLDRDAPAAPELAAELISGHAEPQVRSLAAVALGRLAGPTATSALLAAVNDADSIVLRRVAQSLVRVGDAAALAPLARVQPPLDTPAGRDVLAARMLIGYRHGVPDVLAQPGVQTDYGRRRGEPITLGGRGRLPKTTVVESIARELPLFTVRPDSVQLFTCSGVRGALVIDALDAAPDPADLTAPRMVGALLRDRVCADRYSIDCYLLSDDRDGTGGTRPHLWMVRPSGRVVHAGRAEITGDGIDFAVTRSVAPYAFPVKVAGTMSATGKVSISVARVGKPAADAATARVPAERSTVMR